MEPPEVIEIDTEIVACDGGGPLGHPRVYLNTEGRGVVDCPYCGRRFVLKEGAAAACHHTRDGSGEIQRKRSISPS
jgi:uncharacterized Zn-finger protein